MPSTGASQPQLSRQKPPPLRKHSRSHPFLNLQFTALNPVAHVNQDSPSATEHSVRGFSHRSELHAAMLRGAEVEIDPEEETNSKHRIRTRTHSSTSLSDYSVERQCLPHNPTKSAPSSPRANASNHYFTPSATPHIISPLSQSPAGSPRPQSRSFKKQSRSSSATSLTFKGRSNSSPHLNLQGGAAMFSQEPGYDARGTRGILDVSAGHLGGSAEVYGYMADSLGLVGAQNDKGDDSGISFSAGSRRKSTPFDGIRNRSNWNKPDSTYAYGDGVANVKGFETEDDMAQPLPTARISPESFEPPSSNLMMLRFLSVIPATVACIEHLSRVIQPEGNQMNERSHYCICIFWALLTANQTLSITTGLLYRWRIYYSLPPTVIRLLALQAICWSATHLTLRLFDHSRRPLVCWTIIGTTTCMLKSIQMWSTSNLRSGNAEKPRTRPSSPVTDSDFASSWLDRALTRIFMFDESSPNDWGGRPCQMRPRKWDWGKVTKKCIMPAAIIYFVMAWTLLVKNEMSSPDC